MKPVTVINRLVVKPGKIDEFLAAQEKFAATLGPCGLVGGRMYRGVDGLSAVLVSTFRSKSEATEVQKRPEFVEHLKRMATLVDSSTPDFYEEEYTYGDVSAAPR
jgi:hypothetical protein